MQTQHHFNLLIRAVLQVLAAAAATELVWLLRWKQGEKGEGWQSRV